MTSVRLASFLLFLAASAAHGQPIEFLHITDTHLMKIDGIHPALFMQRQANVLSAAQLESVFEELKAKPPAFLLHTGDILEAFRYDSESGGVLEGQIERFQEMVKRSPAPFYLALGNRDVSWYRAADGKQLVVRDKEVTREARAAWRAAFECFRNGTWYSFEKRAGGTRFLFVVLDNGETSDQVMAKRQIGWLRDLLARADQAALVLAVHIPVEENAFGQEVRETLAGFDRPVLILAGHRHTDEVSELSASPRRVQVRTASFAGGKMSMRKVALKSDAIEIYATSEPERLLLTIPVSAR